MKKMKKCLANILTVSMLVSIFNPNAILASNADASIGADTALEPGDTASDPDTNEVSLASNSDSLGYRTVRFDLGIYGKYEEVSLPDIKYDGKHKKIIETTATSSNASDGSIVATNLFDDKDKYPRDTAFNKNSVGQVDSECLELPWWNVPWNANDGKGASYQEQLRKYKEGTGPKPVKPQTSWGGVDFNFNGYSIAGWNCNMRGFEEPSKIMKYFPFINVDPSNPQKKFEYLTYSPIFKDDGTTFNIKIHHNLADGNDAIPFKEGRTLTVDEPHMVLESLNIHPLNIPGYKSTLDENTGIKIYEPGTDTEACFKNKLDKEGHAIKKTIVDPYGWKITTNKNEKDPYKYIEGISFNKDLDITYEYKSTGAKDFSLLIRHVEVGKDGIETELKTEKRQLAAEEEINNVGPLKSLCQKNGDFEPKYVLIGGDLGADHKEIPKKISNNILAFSGNKPNEASNENKLPPMVFTSREDKAFDDNENYYNVSIDSSTEKKTYELITEQENKTFAHYDKYIANITRKVGKYFNDDYTLNAKMPNQNLVVVYRYRMNPNYKIGVDISYVDSDGKNIGKEVLDAAKKLNADKFNQLTLDSDNKIFMKHGKGESFDAPLPNLSSLGYETPRLISKSDPSQGAKVELKPEENIMNLSIDEMAYSIKIEYPKKDESWGNITVNADSFVSLINKSGEAYNPAKDKVSGRISDVVEGSDTHERITLDKSELEKLPNIHSNLPGYEPDGYYLNDTLIIDKDKRFVDTTKNKYEIEDLGDGYNLTAKVKKKTDGWRKYILQYDSRNTDVSPEDAKKEISIYTLNATGTIRNGDDKITWKRLKQGQEEEFKDIIGNVSPESGYTIKWYDDHNNELDDNDEEDFLIKYSEGSIFFAKAIPNNISIDKPELEPEIDRYGEPCIKINNTNSHPLVKYLLSDNNGKILKILSLEEISNNGYFIKDNDILFPDTEYTISEILPEVSANIGTNISTIDTNKIKSTKVKTLVCKRPRFLDGTPPKINAAFTSFKKGCYYAIIRNDNNEVVKSFTKVDNSDGEFIFENLDKKVEYSIVVAKAADEAPLDSNKTRFKFRTPENAQFAKLHIANAGNPDEVIYSIEPEGLNYDQVEIGSKVVLYAKLEDALGHQLEVGNAFTLLEGQIDDFQYDKNTRCEFTMPTEDVTIRVNYTPSLASFSDAYIVDYKQSQPDFEITNPPIVERGKFRVYLERKASDDTNVNKLKNERKDFKGLYQIFVKVQQFVNNAWKDYDTYADKIKVKLKFAEENDPEKEYKLYRIDEHLDIDTPSLRMRDENFTSQSYLKNFDIKTEYIFGYSTINSYTINIKNLYTNVEKSFDFKYNDDDQMKAIQDIPYEWNNIIREDVNQGGVTYTYKGVSRASDSFDELEMDSPIEDGNKSLYLYYSNDSEERQQLETKLRQLLNENEAKKKYVRDTYDAADKALKQTSPRKSSSQELKDAIENLKIALDNIDMSSGHHSGGSSGGGIGGGTPRPPQPQNPDENIDVKEDYRWYRTYEIGADGNWKLLDKDKDMWIFEFNNGKRMTGWANLSYTYNATRRVGTYHFGADGVMDYGWFKDKKGRWYYMSEEHDGFFGHMIRGWKREEKDNAWYYLSEKNGRMLLGWQNINGKWYYLNPETIKPTWIYDVDSATWKYQGNNKVRTYGSLYQNERTPDNFYVDYNGVWIENK